MLNPLAVYAFVAASAAAQSATPAADLAAGTRIRISVRSEGPGAAHTLRGTITSYAPGSLTVTPDGESKAVVLRSDQVARLERLHKRSNRTKGAMIGASILGGAMTALWISYCSSGWGCDGESGRIVALVGGSAALGALLGIAGSHGDQWREVPLVSR
jgi:hypothetical protein